MNFFGHAFIASRRTRSPVLALGAMLPDFASMCGGRIARVVDAELAAGVALHHATDATFHRLPAFLDLYRHATERLQQRGVGRGPARGAAHVAVELLLDGELLGDAAACRIYLDALAVRGEELVHWEAPEQAVRWQRLRERLRTAGVPAHYGEPDAVAARVAATLRHRPLLRLDDAALARLRAEMGPLQQRVAARTPALMGTLQASLIVPHAPPDTP